MRLVQQTLNMLNTHYSLELLDTQNIVVVVQKLDTLTMQEALKLLVMQEAQMKRDTLIMLELLFDQKALKEQEVH